MPRSDDAVKTYVALLRGINVVGSGILPMKELVAILESLGCRNVRTYIQSGNAVFEHRETTVSNIAPALGQAIQKKRGFAPHVQIVDAKLLTRIVAGNPFPVAVSDPKTLHVFFLDAKPAKTKLPVLAELRNATEQCELRGDTFYLYAPDGIGRSKLAANVERKLGVTATSRNWRTVCKLLEIALETK
jgi:uncharacterized protein (DUF1697 family)